MERAPGWERETWPPKSPGPRRENEGGEEPPMSSQRAGEGVEAVFRKIYDREV